MNDYLDELPVSGSRSNRNGRSKLAEVAKMTGDMLVLTVIAFGIGMFLVPGHETALAALGIAVYVSCEHCKIVRAEVRNLRAQLRHSAPRRRRRAVRAVDRAYVGEAYSAL